MLTDKDMLEIAEKYLKKMEGGKAQELGQETFHELMITETTKKPLGNVYDFGIRLFQETLDPRYRTIVSCGNAKKTIKHESEL